MKITCPHCNEKFDLTLSGHPLKLDMPVITIINTLSECSSITQAAKKLGCSRAYIYFQLKLKGKQQPKYYLKADVNKLDSI
jgi:hypothetical protein